MKNKEKIGIVLVLGLLVIPLLKLQAEDDDIRTGTNIKVEAEDSRQLPKLGTPSTVRTLLDDDKDSENESERENESEGSKIRANIGVKTEVKQSSVDKARVQTEIDARKKEVTQKVAGLRAEVKVKLDVNAQDRVKKLLGNIFNMFTNQIDRLTKVDARIGEKIASMKASDVDVTAAEAQYIKAEAALAKAKIDVAATNSASIDQTSATTSKEELRALVKIAEDSIKACGKEYMQILSMLPEKNTDTKVETKTSSSTSVKQ